MDRAPSQSEVRQAFRQGKWVPGKIAPAPLPPDLAKLPGDYVTRDIYDDTRVHAEGLDPEYIRDEIVEARQTAEEAGSGQMDEQKAVLELTNDDLYRHVEVTQHLLDVLRFKIIGTLIYNEMIAVQMNQKAMPEFPVQHLWFTVNDICARELRRGNPPADSQRPKWLRGLDLVVDPLNWPPSIVAKLKAVGYNVPSLEDMYNKLKTERSSMGLDTKRIILPPGRY